MLPLSLGSQNRRLMTVLCLGAHCDDIELGCGGTILKMAEEYPETQFYWVVFSSSPVRKNEAQQSAELFLKGTDSTHIVIKEFRNGYFPYIGTEIKDYFEQLKCDVSPDLIFTHYGKDLHQDHRLLSELTWNTFRDHLILEYEIAKYDGDLGTPNIYSPLSEQRCGQKVKYITSCFESQASKHWFAEDVFYSLLRLRGMECNSVSGYAEAFYCRKSII